MLSAGRSPLIKSTSSAGSKFGRCSGQRRQLSATMRLMVMPNK